MVGQVSPRRPFLQRAHDLLFGPIRENAFGKVPRPAIRRFQMLQQIEAGRVGELRRLCEWTIFGGDAPDAPVRFVPVRMAKTRLIMTDDRIVPVANVERAVRAKLHIHGPKTPAGRFNQRRQIFQGEPCAIVADFERPHGVVDVTADNQRALPRVGKVREGDDQLARIRINDADISVLTAFLRTLNEDLKPGGKY